MEKPGLYVVSTEVTNEGMKYTDAFYVATKFCIIQRDAEQSLLRVSAEVRYVKSVNGIARGNDELNDRPIDREKSFTVSVAFIDKNANASIETSIMNYSE